MRMPPHTRLPCPTALPHYPPPPLSPCPLPPAPPVPHFPTAPLPPATGRDAARPAAAARRPAAGGDVPVAPPRPWADLAPDVSAQARHVAAAQPQRAGGQRAERPGCRRARRAPPAAIAGARARSAALGGRVAARVGAAPHRQPSAAQVDRGGGGGDDGGRIPSSDRARVARGLRAANSDERRWPLADRAAGLEGIHGHATLLSSSECATAILDRWTVPCVRYAFV